MRIFLPTGQSNTVSWILDNDVLTDVRSDDSMESISDATVIKEFIERSFRYDMLKEVPRETEDFINQSVHYNILKGTLSETKQFNDDEVIDAIESFIGFGIEMSRKEQNLGYFAGNGWAARCLRWHLKQLKNKQNEVAE